MAAVKFLGTHVPAGLDLLVAESILPPNPSPELYRWETYQNAAGHTGEEELLTTQHCVVWSKGGVVQRFFRLDREGDPILQSLLTWFDDSKQKLDDQNSLVASSKSRALVIIFKLKAHVCFLNGPTHIISLPVEIDRAFPTTRGLILQRKQSSSRPGQHLSPSLRAPPNSLQVSRNQLWSSPISSPVLGRRDGSAFSTARNLTSGLPNILSPQHHTHDHVPRFLTLTDPLLEAGVVVESLNRTASPLNLLPIDPNEEILNIEECRYDLSPNGQSGESLAYVLTANRHENRYTIWKASYIQPTSLTQWNDEVDDSINPSSPLLHKSFTHQSSTTGTTPGNRASIGKRESFMRDHPSQQSFDASQNRQGRKSESFRNNEKNSQPNDPLAIGANFNSPNKNSAANRRASSIVARAELFTDEAAVYKDWSRQSTGLGGSQVYRNRRYPSSNFGHGRHSFEATLLPATPSDAMQLNTDSETRFSNMPVNTLRQDPFDSMKAEIVMEKLLSLPFKIPDVQLEDYDQGNVLPAPSNSMKVVVLHSEDGQWITHLLYNVVTSTLSEITIRLPEPYAKRSQTEPQDNFLINHTTEVAGIANLVDAGESAFIVARYYNGSGLNVKLFPRVWKSSSSTLLLRTLALTDESRGISIRLPEPNEAISSNPLKTSSSFSSSALPKGDFDGGTFSNIASAKDCLVHPGNFGEIDISNHNLQFSRYQIHLQPRNKYVKKVLDLCQHFLSEDTQAKAQEHLLSTWWQVCQKRSPDTPNGEWENLIVALFSLFFSAFSDVTSLRSMAGPHYFPTSTTNETTLPIDWNLVANFLAPSNQRPKNLSLLHYCRAAWEFLQRAHSSEALALGKISRNVEESRHYQLLWSRLVLGLHLLREEEILDTSSAEANPALGIIVAPVLAQFGQWFGWKAWSGDPGTFYSCEDEVIEAFLYDDSIFSELQVSPPFQEPPSILTWISQVVASADMDDFPSLSELIENTTNPRQGTLLHATKQPLAPRTHAVVSLFRKILGQSTTPASVIETMMRRGLDGQSLETFPEGVIMALRSLIARFRNSPATSLPEMPKYVEREDLHLLHGLSAPKGSIEQMSTTRYVGASGLDVRRICEMPSNIPSNPDSRSPAEIMKLIFRVDTRALEPAKLLCPQLIPVAIMHPIQGHSESQFLEAQQNHAKLVYVRTMSLVSGQALLEYQFHKPLPTQKLDIRLFNTSCRMQPSGILVNADRSNFVEEKVSWAFFHAGVQAGLRINEDTLNLETSWLSLNKPNDLGNRHAGLLLGLGLNGHLKTMAKWLIFKYLTHKHDMTSIGLLLGLSASRIGSLDSLITRVLSIHLVCLLPPGSAELNLSPLVQTAGMMGIGLLYYGSHHRRMSEKMLLELEHVELDPSNTTGSSFSRDEGYRLAAGFSLGLINLGKGNKLSSLRGLQVEERLIQLATGTYGINVVHILDQATAGAIIAIALIFMKTELKSIADQIDIPYTTKRFDTIRPDMLLLRVLAKNLILWNEIEPTQAWIWSQLPPDLLNQLGPTPMDTSKSEVEINILDFEFLEPLSSCHLSLYNILAGLCWNIGLKFAGTADLRARDILMSYYDKATIFLETTPKNYDQRVTRDALMRLQHLLILSATTVMSGTGDLPLLRRLRLLHASVNQYSTFGYHQAAHMAMGALFLGQGRYSFGTSNLATAALICAFYPIFPQEVLDNRAHLQAFRHFWVLAAEPRCLFPRDVETRSIVTIPIEVTRRDGTISTIVAPTLLPDIGTIARVRTLNEEYWEVVLNFESNSQHVASFKKYQTIFLKRKSLLAQYKDPFSTSLALQIGQKQAYRGSLDVFKWIFNLSTFEPLGITQAQADSIFPRDQLVETLGSSILPGKHSSTGIDASDNVPLSTILDRRTTGIDDVLVLRGDVESENRSKLMGLRILLQWAELERSRGRTLEWSEWIGEEALGSLRAALLQRAQVEAMRNAEAQHMDASIVKEADVTMDDRMNID